MANEKLVSTVQYSGQSVGTVELTIQDTSFYPTYTFKVIELSENKEMDLGHLQQLCKYKLTFKQDTLIPELKFVYVKFKTLDGKLVSQANSVVGSPTETSLTLSVDANGEGFTLFDTNYFPSYIGYGGEVYFYHDVECTKLIRIVYLNVLPVTSGGLEIIPARNVSENGDLSFYPPYIEMGEDFVVRVNILGPSTVGGVTKVPFNGFVNVQTLASNQWMPSNQVSEIDLSKVNNVLTNPITGKKQYTTIPNPTDKNKQNISAIMGEVRIGNDLRYPSYIDGFGWVNSSIRTVKLYRRLGPSTTDKRCVGIVQGLSVGTDASARLGPSIITKASDWDEAFVQGLVPVLGANNPTLYSQNYLGKMGAVTWDPALLTTRESRVQFGKYQKSFTKVIDNTNNTSLTVTWNDISDSMADVDYGVPSTLIGSDVVVLVQPHDRADICNLLFNTGGSKEFYIRPVSYNSVGANLVYNGLVSVLVLRKSAMLDTYPSWVPYPRVIKADWAPGTILEGEGAWVITIPDGTTIDLTEDRYVVQHTHEQTEQNGGNITYSWTNNRIKKEKSKITIFGSTTNSYPDPKHYAIWDLGPEVAFNTPDDGRLRGEIKPLNISPWVTKDLSGPVDSSTASVVVMPTLGESTQFYQSSVIWRTVTQEPKKFTVWARNTTAALYQGEFGLLVWNVGEMTNNDRRNQFGRYQTSMTVPYNSANGVSTITLEQINNDAATSVWGSLSSLKDPNLMMFINTEEYSEWNSTFWDIDKIQIGINYGSGPSFVGNVSVLFMRKVGWISHASATKYPRVIYADVINIGGNLSYTLPINKSFMSDPLNGRYQLMAQVKPASQNDSWVKFRYSKLTRSIDDWKIDLDGGEVTNNLQIAIIDYGPDVTLFGKYDPFNEGTGNVITDLTPVGTVSQDPRFSYQISTGRATGYGSSSWMMIGITQRGQVPVEGTRNVTPFIQGVTNDGTWGYGRRSSKGLIGWDNLKRVGKEIYKQVPCFVGRALSLVGMSEITLDDVRADHTSAVNSISNFKDPNSVIISMTNFGTVWFSYKRSTDGQKINLTDNYNDTPWVLQNGQTVSTLILKKMLTNPTFAADVPYPRIIKADIATSVLGEGDFFVHYIDLTDPSYAGVDLGNDRYQVVLSFEAVGGFTGKTTCFSETKNGAGLALRMYDNRSSQLGTVAVNYIVVDYGPSNNNGL